MPVIELETNVKVDDSRELLRKLTKFSAQLFGKPESIVLAKYTYNESLSWGGTFDPAFLLKVNSIDSFAPEKNPFFVEEYTKFLKENLSVDEKRGFIILSDPGKDTTGHDGTTITKLFG